MKKGIFLMLAAALISCPLNLAAAGLEVAPSALQSAGDVGRPIKEVLLIKNPDATEANFQVYINDFSTAITINPSAFTLKPQETKVVTLKANFSAPGIYKTNISVVAKPQAADRFRANTGVKISWEISITQPNSSQPFLASVRGLLNKQISLGYLMAALAVLLIFWLIWAMVKRRWQPLNKG